MPIADLLPPQTVQETLVRRSILQELALKLMFNSEALLTLDLAGRMGLSNAVVEEICQQLRKEQLCEVKGMYGPYYRLGLSAQGRAQAAEALSRNRYVGPAPVAIAEYDVRVHSQSIQQTKVAPSRMSLALHELVLNPDIVERLGSAASSGTTVLLHGPAGTGKTSVATRMHLVYNDPVWIPHAVEIDGQIITVYDPTIHRKVPRAESLNERDDRWVLCERPSILAGGELSAHMLELQYDPVAGFYSAPLQMKANNGVLIVDDFGRQTITPQTLLNRWLTPLDRRVDYLSFTSGMKFAIPFDVFVIFSTNLDPQLLADEAFQRRIPNKIHFGYSTTEQFQEIFRRECEKRLLPPDEGISDWLARYLSETLRQPLRPCYPRDLLQQLFWSTNYRDTETRLTVPALEAACRNYFLPGGGASALSSAEVLPDNR